MFLQYSFSKNPLTNVSVPYDLARRPRNRPSQYVTISSGGESFETFVPVPLPPVPHIRTGALMNFLDRANQGLGRLDGIASILPDVSLLISVYAKKEALLSSQIEGTQPSLSSLLLFELAEPDFPSHDVEDILNYVNALNHGLKRVSENMPFVLVTLSQVGIGAVTLASYLVG